MIENSIAQTTQVFFFFCELLVCDATANNALIEPYHLHWGLTHLNLISIDLKTHHIQLSCILHKKNYGRAKMQVCVTKKKYLFISALSMYKHVQGMEREYT